MKLTNRYLYIQLVRTILSYGCSATLWIVGIMAIRFMQFREQGFGMYPGLRVPKGITLPQSVDFFYRVSIEPLVLYLILAIIVDLLIRKYVLKIYFPKL